ncbi:testis-expressed sequence 264 protein [Arapaima gigas]
MSELLIWALIVLVIVSLLLTIVGYVVYSGLLSEIIIRTGSPPIKNITFAYKLKAGPYKECGALFTESCSIGPKLSSIGVFYDDPKEVAKEKCRYAVGSILSEGEDKPSEEMMQLYQKFGFQIFSFPAVTHAVTASFPHRTPLSIIIGVQRVYPVLTAYIKERKLCAHPFLEIYRGDLIYYMSPLARQGDFYVPELQVVERAPQDGEDSEEDCRTDVTGADSNSESSSVSRTVAWGSREASPAPSAVPSLASREPGDGDHADECSSGGSVDSSSSFEELGLELVEGKEEGAGAQGKFPETPVLEREAITEGEE